MEISANDQIQYDKSKISVAADCDKVKLTLVHSGQMNAKQMGHSWVLAKTADWKDLAQQGAAAGAENEYLPKDNRVVAHTGIIGGGKSTSITFNLSDLDSEGDYTFFCSFPGHWLQMNGKFEIQ